MKHTVTAVSDWRWQWTCRWSTEHDSHADAAEQGLTATMTTKQLDRTESRW